MSARLRGQGAVHGLLLLRQVPGPGQGRQTGQGRGPGILFKGNRVTMILFCTSRDFANRKKIEMSVIEDVSFYFATSYYIK